ncbi:hypothetical protein CVT24_006893 [Panaeolus cyanescens]|uniref:3'-5' exonuclease n=1 Tax=Panaeolus cyanescens TaxID=181874 RepID=A0A409YP17_9AGAR|nr:hypothetical protein CVT24_006893 [Panaeolus cyanescens]
MIEALACIEQDHTRQSTSPKQSTGIVISQTSVSEDDPAARIRSPSLEELQAASTISSSSIKPFFAIKQPFESESNGDGIDDNLDAKLQNSGEDDGEMGPVNEPAEKTKDTEKKNSRGTKPLTLTKAHDERDGPLKGIAESIKKFGYEDPFKDKSLIYKAFPSLSQNLKPAAAAYGLQPLTIPLSIPIHILDNATLVNNIFSSLLSPLDSDTHPDSHLCVSMDAEWNLSRWISVSWIQIIFHSEPGIIYLVPLYKFKQIPTSLLRLLVPTRVFKIGASIKGDLTRIKKQFPEQLENITTFTVLDLKSYCTQHNVIARGTSGALDTLVEKTLGSYLAKDDHLRRSEEREKKTFDADYVHYAALDVYATYLVFQHALERSPGPDRTIDTTTPPGTHVYATYLVFQHALERSPGPDRTIDTTTPPGTRVALLAHIGGIIIAYGRIVDPQPGTRVKTTVQSRLLVQIDEVLNESAAMILHRLPGQSTSSRTKAGAYTLGQLRKAAEATSEHPQVVSLISHLDSELAIPQSRMSEPHSDRPNLTSRNQEVQMDPIQAAGNGPDSDLSPDLSLYGHRIESPSINSASNVSSGSKET